MVAFLSPKKSKVDIVQAIGRAMRKSGSKEVGYVLIPLYLEQEAGESIEEAVARANFEEVWDILQSLQEQDDVLAELIRDLAVAKGSGKGFDDSRFSDRIAFTGPVLALESIHQAVSTKVLERLESSWDVNCGKLVKFKEEHGHCRVPAYSKNDPQLSNWVINQRAFFAKGTINQSKILKLDSIGFEWSPKDTDWDESYKALKLFKNKYGHCLVPRSYKDENKLSAWVSFQRVKKRKGWLRPEQQKLLDQLGFVWNAGKTKTEKSSKTWEESFAELIRFKEIHGHCNVPRSYSESEALALWVSNQRAKKKRGVLLAEREKSLDTIGFSWNHKEEENSAFWNQNYALLQDFKMVQGHCDVPAAYPKNPSFGFWVMNQRNLKRKGQMPLEIEEKLNAIEFIWDVLEKEWNDCFSALLKYKEEHGHCDVPVSFKENPLLGRWIGRQRLAKKKGKLSPEREQLLNGIGFVWIKKPGGSKKHRK